MDSKEGDISDSAW